jgi:hypothetical protein
MTARGRSGYLRRMPPRIARSASLLSACTLAALAVWSCASASGGGGSVTAIQSTGMLAANMKHVGVLTEGEGSLLLSGSDTDSLVVRYALNARTRSALFRNQVETIDKGDTAFVTIRPTPGTSIDLQVEMPEHVSLSLRDEARDVLVRNMENRVDVALHAGGSLELDDIEGQLVILDGGGPIRVHDVRGPIEIRDESGRITIREVANSVTIDSRVGDVAIESVRGDVTLSVGPGDLTVRDVTGKLSYRKIGPGKVTIENVAGGVEKL